MNKRDERATVNVSKATLERVKALLRRLQAEADTDLSQDDIINELIDFFERHRGEFETEIKYSRNIWFS